MTDDYYVRFLPFPNRAARAATLLNDDGSYDIFINTLFPESVQRRALEHELRHIRFGHLSDGESVALLEAAARGESVSQKSICCYSPAGNFEHFVPKQSRADFALVVGTHGMRPHYRKGQLLLCKNRPPDWDGDTAVFLIDGKAELRQVYLDFTGRLYLLNHNRRYADSDLVFLPEEEPPPLLGTPLRRRRLPPVRR